MIRCKFTVTAANIYENGSEKSVSVTLRPEYNVDGSIPEDLVFTKFTPSGEFTANITNPLAIPEFIVGRKFYLDLTPITKDEDEKY